MLTPHDSRQMTFSCASPPQITRRISAPTESASCRSSPPTIMISSHPCIDLLLIHLPMTTDDKRVLTKCVPRTAHSSYSFSYSGVSIPSLAHQSINQKTSKGLVETLIQLFCKEKCSEGRRPPEAFQPHSRSYLGPTCTFLGSRRRWP